MKLVKAERVTPTPELSEGYTTLLQNIEGEISYPYTVADVVMTKEFTSDMATDLANIEQKHQDYEDGNVKVGYAVKADKFAKPQRINLTGGATGHVDIDGTNAKEFAVVISDDSHEHTYETIPGLRQELVSKLGVEHDHEHWNTYGTLVIGDHEMPASKPADQFKLIPGSNIELTPLEDGSGVEVTAILADVIARDSRKLAGYRPVQDADKSANETFVPMTQYGGAMEVGQHLDFHLPGSRKDYDIRLGIDSDLNPYIRKNDATRFDFWHNGNMGHGTGLDADLLDGRQGSDYSLTTHNHENYEQTMALLKQTKGRQDWYTPLNILGTKNGTNGVPAERNKATYEAQYDWVLNRLMREHPDYISKTVLGKDASGTYNIYRYDFTPADYDRTILILSNVHGNEYTSFYGVCRLMEDLCERHQSNALLSELRERVRIVLLPIVNPWGFINGRRQNSNDVDLNRNANYRWSEYTTADSQLGGRYYKGTEPFSEVESQYVRQVVEELMESNFVGSMDLHTITTIEAEKVLYYPRFQGNLKQEFAKLMTAYQPETGLNREIFATSNLPTLSNWIAHHAKINACNPEWCNAAYGNSRDDFLMRKHVEWIGNILVTLSRASKPQLSSVAQPFTKFYTWKKDKTLGAVDDANRMSNKGHRVLNSNNYNTFSLSQVNIEVDSEYIMHLTGHVQVTVERACTLHLEPLIYQQHSSEQSYNVMTAENRYEEEVDLTPGVHYIPIQGVLHVFHSNYNDSNSSRSGLVHFRLRAKTNVTDSVWISGYKANLAFTPSDRDIPVTVDRLGHDRYEVVYPTQVMEDIED